MALITCGTQGANALTGMIYANSSTGGQSAIDKGQFNNAIKRDRFSPGAPFHALVSGQLFIPHRGVLNILPGDLIAYDVTGWPILVSAAAAASASWAHT